MIQPLSHIRLDSMLALAQMYSNLFHLFRWKTKTLTLSRTFLPAGARRHGFSESAVQPISDLIKDMCEMP
jgi:hypothetical protein